MTMRMDKAKGEEDLQKLQSYRSNLVSFKANLENKYSELNEEVETAGRYEHCFVFFMLAI